MKILSIVVPVYNMEEYIRRCLDSVVNISDRTMLEVIIVNDGSSDGSLDIAREYAERYPECVILIDKENGGHGSTVNRGLEAASGKYFRVLDSDDWFDTSEFEKYLQGLIHCDEDLVLTPYTQEYTSSGKQVKFAYEEFEHDKVYTWDDVKSDETSMFFTMASSSYKTEMLRECRLHLFEKSFFVDMQYNVYPIPYLKTIRFLDFEVYRYFIGRSGQSVSTESLIRNLPQHERVLRFIADYYTEKQSVCSKNQAEYMALIFHLMYYTHIDVVCQKLKDRSEAYRIIKKIDKDLKISSPELYKKASAFPYLRWSRRLGYINVRFFNKPFSWALGTAWRMLKK